MYLLLKELQSIKARLMHVVMILTHDEEGVSLPDGNCK